MAVVDVVVVSYNSRDMLRGCVETLLGSERFNVIVVDNASPDGSLAAVADLDLVMLQRDSNGGFARACNEGWRIGSAPYVLFLNPDARIDAESLERLVDRMEADPRIGVAGPKTLDFDGALVHSQREFLSLRSIWAQAFYLHHLLRRASWTDGIIRASQAYEHEASPEWISGACMLLRRDALEQLGGFDEGFFMYCEDQDLCRRCRARGLDVRFAPSAVAYHVGGASAPRAAQLQVLVSSRIRFLSLYMRPAARLAGRMGLALAELFRTVLTRGGLEDRVGHVRALRAALVSPLSPTPRSR